MARKKHISAVISLKDNMSATLRGIKREQKVFQREVRQTRKEIQSANKQKMKIRMDSTVAHKKIQKLRKDLAPLRKKVATAVALKDETTAKIKKIKSEVKAVGRFIAKPLIIAKDKATSTIKKIKSTLKSIGKKIAIPIAIAGATVGATLKGGAELEQQQISLRHFMGVGNKDKSSSELDGMSASYLKELRNNANSTPFETGEVISAGTRALQIEGGNAKDAMQMVKLAEDMAALNPGKTVSDAMEALADANVGEMERLKEFGLKASSKDNPEDVKKQLQEMYEGGAEKLAASGAGLWSTIMGKLKSNLADTGLKMLEPLKPVMTDLIGFIDNVTPAMLSIGESITSGLATGISWIKEQMPIIGPIFSSVFTSCKTIVQAVIPVIGQIIQALSPVFMGLLNVAKIVFSGVASVIQVVAPIVSGLISGLKPVFSGVGKALNILGGIFNSVFGAIKTVVQGCYNFIKPIIEAIKSGLSVAKEALSKVGGGRTPGQNATGTKYWTGGLSLVGEHGPELVEMPSGSKVYTNRESKSILNNGKEVKSTNTSLQNINLNIAKLADQVIIREDADIDKISKALVDRLRKTKLNYGGAY